MRHAAIPPRRCFLQSVPVFSIKKHPDNTKLRHNPDVSVPDLLFDTHALSKNQRPLAKILAVAAEQDKTLKGTKKQAPAVSGKYLYKNSQQ